MKFKVFLFVGVVALLINSFVGLRISKSQGVTFAKAAAATSATPPIPGARVPAVRTVAAPEPIVVTDSLATLEEKFRALSLDPKKASWGSMAVLKERMLELAPNDKELAVYALSIRFYDLIQPDGDGDSGDGDVAGKRAALDRDIAAAEKIPGLEKPVLEIKVNLARVDGNADEMTRLAVDLKETHPESPAGTYYLAWAAALSGDGNGAKALLAEAAKKQDPNDTRAAFALDRLKQEPGAKMNTVFLLSPPGMLQ